MWTTWPHSSQSKGSAQRGVLMRILISVTNLKKTTRGLRPEHCHENRIKHVSLTVAKHTYAATILPSMTISGTFYPANVVFPVKIGLSHNINISVVNIIMESSFCKTTLFGNNLAQK